MASSRLEKIGTIFTRVNGLLKSGAMKWEDRPVWYDIYKAYPPKDEPKFDRPAPDISVRSIFYEEDSIRALYHKNSKNLGSLNLFSNDSQSRTKKFLEIFQKLEASQTGISKEEIYEEAIQMLNRELEKQPLEGSQGGSSLAGNFKQAKEQQHKQQQVPKIDVKDIFKE